MKKVWELFLNFAYRIVNDWISGRQKPCATRMRTERLKKKVGLYQITKTKIYKFKYLTQKSPQNIIDL